MIDRVKMFMDNNRENPTPKSEYEKAFNVSKCLVQFFPSLWCRCYKNNKPARININIPD